MTELTVVRLNRFPIKGLSAEPLESLSLTKGDGIPGDRFFGFARYNSGFDPENPEPLPKERFVVLVKEAALAGLKTTFDDATLALRIDVKGTHHSFDLRRGDQCRKAGLFLHETLGLTDPEPPVFVSSAPHRFTDVSVVSPQMMNAVSLVNHASLADFGTRIGAHVHPARFRANIEIDRLPPYSELDCVGKTLVFGNVKMRILSRTKRCAATEVNPISTKRDLKIPYLLRKELGHMDMGVYLEIVVGGRLAVGQSGQLQE